MKTTLKKIGVALFTITVVLLQISCMSSENGTPDSYPGPDEQLESVLVTGSRLGAEGPDKAMSWNTWMESGVRSEPQFSPLPVLENRQTYTLFIDYSAIPFDEEGVSTEEESEQLRKSLENLLGDTAELTVLLLPDNRFFLPGNNESMVKNISIDLIKLREYMADPGLGESDDSDDPLKSFGRTVFTLKTTQKQGFGGIGISIWVNGMPIDESSFTICIGEMTGNCEDEEPYIPALAGYDSVRLASGQEESPLPDAALHFVHLNWSQIVGVFRCNTCDWPMDQYVTWELNSDFDSLQDYLSNTIQPAFENAARLNNADEFSYVGQDFFRVLFDRRAAGGIEAVEAFHALVKKVALDESGNTPSLFIRLLPTEGDQVPNFMLPLNLIAIQIEGIGVRFLGSLFRIESPLPDQDYGSNQSCLADWTALVPPLSLPETDELRIARGKMGTFIIDLYSNPDRAAIYDSIEGFRSWITDDEGVSLTNPEQRIIMLLSHHEDNRLFFDFNNQLPALHAGSIQRLFASPSLAIINACGAASPGASDFVWDLNVSGIHSIIATGTTVNAKMAGDFMALLYEKLHSNEQNQDYVLGQATFDTLNELNSSYGPMAYIYSLLGSGNLHVCTPSMMPN